MRRLLTCTLAATAFAAPSAHASGEPDLTIRLPEGTSGTPSVFVDALEVPGRVLYRFDSILENEGGTLDLYRDPESGGVRQAIWPTGEPTTEPMPDQLPQGEVEIKNRSGFGSTFDYAVEKTHQHFHFSSAARYELRPEGGTPVVSDKVGFCMFDTSGPARWFRWMKVNGATWCGFDNPGQSIVRMGLSAGSGDRYSAQREFQWVDITGVDPGPAVLRAQANPLHCVIESDETNNTTDDARTLPGVLARPAEAAIRAGEVVTVPLAGEVIAPDVPARRPGSCAGGFCYARASASDPLAFALAVAPEHGSVTLSGAEATYTPAADFTGEDSFGYTATDARGLTSTPATAKVSVVAAPTPNASPAPGASTPAASARAALSSIRVRHRGDRWRVELRASAPALLSARLERRSGGRRALRRALRSRRVLPGAARVALGRLRPGRYRVGLRLDGRPAGSVSFVVG